MPPSSSSSPGFPSLGSAAVLTALSRNALVIFSSSSISFSSSLLLTTTCPARPTLLVIESKSPTVSIKEAACRENHRCRGGSQQIQKHSNAGRLDPNDFTIGGLWDEGSTGHGINPRSPHQDRRSRKSRIPHAEEGAPACVDAAMHTHTHHTCIPCQLSGPNTQPPLDARPFLFIAPAPLLAIPEQDKWSHSTPAPMQFSVQLGAAASLSVATPFVACLGYYAENVHYDYY
ncbi:hypothetical protein JB92DRAFT_3107028 [Gautieria morchelliformis]|nr:hypothetical protein JB92DRAFT_3107028 [Gautieria morchelliformis]